MKKLNYLVTLFILIAGFQGYSQNTKNSNKYFQFSFLGSYYQEFKTPSKVLGMEIKWFNKNHSHMMQFLPSQFEKYGEASLEFTEYLESRNEYVLFGSNYYFIKKPKINFSAGYVYRLDYGRLMLNYPSERDFKKDIIREVKKSSKFGININLTSFPFRQTTKFLNVGFAGDLHIFTNKSSMMQLGLVYKFYNKG